MDRLQSSADSAAREPPAGSPGASGTAPRAPAGGRLLNQRCQHCGVDLIDHKRFYKVGPGPKAASAALPRPWQPQTQPHCLVAPHVVAWPVCRR